MLPFPSMSLPLSGFSLVCFSKRHTTVPRSKCRGRKLQKKKKNQGNSEEKKFSMSHCASAFLVGWKLPCHQASLSELNLASWASSSEQRLLFSASTGLCVSDTPQRGGVQVTDSPANLRDKEIHVLDK